MPNSPSASSRLTSTARTPKLTSETLSKIPNGPDNRSNYDWPRIGAGIQELKNWRIGRYISSLWEQEDEEGMEDRTMGLEGMNNKAAVQGRLLKTATDARRSSGS
ncbi:hypothetical protein OIDMADRAFT_33195 [Oidiodendron maius Zn]|uniref:Uncharacterized protein n=1 Tax=Oidiodendron maius (strain Zn) TaxID=913774 RepID=A0A0C3D3Q8_OIDMZ|nr:hypothetical protein OIDMADRAFT_33195 [Oidiodendron maius Zn]